MEQNITQVGGDVINSSFSIGLDSMMGWCSIQSTKGINIYGNSSRALYVQSNDTSKYNALETEGDVVVNGKIHAVSGDNKIQLNSDNNGSIELYGNTPFIDFHSAYSSADYTCRIIANTPEQLLVCGKHVVIPILFQTTILLQIVGFMQDKMHIIHGKTNRIVIFHVDIIITQTILLLCWISCVLCKRRFWFWNDVYRNIRS